MRKKNKNDNKNPCVTYYYIYSEPFFCEVNKTKNVIMFGFVIGTYTLKKIKNDSFQKHLPFRSIFTLILQQFYVDFCRLTSFFGPLRPATSVLDADFFPSMVVWYSNKNSVCMTREKGKVCVALKITGARNCNFLAFLDSYDRPTDRLTSQPTNRRSG